MDSVVRIPAEAEGRLLVVRAVLDKGPEARLVFDSGAGTSALSLACARRMGLSIEQSLRVRTPTGLVSVGTVAVSTLRVGPLEARAVRLAAIPLHNDHIDGLLGLDFFRAVGAVAVTLLLEQAAVEVRLAPA